MRPSVKQQRRGQMQIGEMVMVLVVVFILIIASVVFFVNRAGADSRRATSEQLRLDLATTAKFVATLPELRYSLVGTEDLTAIDFERANEFAQLLVEKEWKPVYRERLAGYKATIEPVYPDPSSYSTTSPNPQVRAPFAALTLFDFTDSVATPRDSVPFTVPILLYEPRTQRTAYGLLTVTQVIT